MIRPVGGVGVGEVPDHGDELLGGLDLGHVPGVAEEFEPGLRDGCRIGATVLGVHDLVALAPHDEGRVRDLGEALAEGGVGHGVRPCVDLQRGAVGGHDRAGGLCEGGRVDGELHGVVEGEPGQFGGGDGEGVGDRVTGDLGAHGVDEDEAADPVAAEQGQFGGDPAAYGVSDDGDVLQTEFVEQPRVGPGEGWDVGQPAGLGGAAEAGVDGGDDPGLPLVGEQPGEGSDRLRTATAVQEQEGWPRPWSSMVMSRSPEGRERVRSPVDPCVGVPGCRYAVTCFWGRFRRMRAPDAGMAGGCPGVKVVAA